MATATDKKDKKASKGPSKGAKTAVPAAAKSGGVAVGQVYENKKAGKQYRIEGKRGTKVSVSSRNGTTGRFSVATESIAADALKSFKLIEK